MEEEASLAQAIVREISPKRRLARNCILYAIILITALAIALAPKEPIYFAFIALAGFNLLALLNYAEEAISK